MIESIRLGFATNSSSSHSVVISPLKAKTKEQILSFIKANPSSKIEFNPWEEEDGGHKFSTSISEVVNFILTYFHPEFAVKFFKGEKEGLQPETIELLSLLPDNIFTDGSVEVDHGVYIRLVDPETLEQHFDFVSPTTGTRYEFGYPMTRSLSEEDFWEILQLFAVRRWGDGY